MTSKASMNALLIVGGVAAAAGVWAAAILLPAPHPRPSSAEAHLRPAIAPAPVEVAVQPAPAPIQAQAPAPQPLPATAAPAAPAPTPAPLFAGVSPAAFGALPGSLQAHAPALRTSLLDNAAPLALASTSIQSIGATFANPTPVAGLPDFGGASQLDGPADAGLEEPVAQAALPEPQAPAPKGRIIVLDASEGTKLDPLRQKNWDLNAVQVIPQSVMPPPKR